MLLARTEARLDVAAAVREHAPYVLRSLRHLGVRTADLEDVAQEVFVVLHRRRADWAEARGSVRAWLYGICVRKAQHHRRTLARRPELAVEVERGASDATEARLDARLLAGWVLDQLDDDKRAVFVLFEIEGLRMKEVAEILGCPLKTGYSRLEAARRTVAAAHATARARGWL
ncbi:MAG: RNA polymerase sigma factor [Myxococcota bacterium]|nr:RNA polymerase sigma factor [Myxococcota bacterium]